MTDSTGDTFSYALTIEYLNEIVFYTAMSLEEPIEEIEEILEFINDSVEEGTLAGDGPGNSAGNRLNALINMIEEAQRLIEAELYDEAIEQLEAAYKHADGQSPPPDFVTGPAVTELTERIEDLIESL